MAEIRTGGPSSGLRVNVFCPMRIPLSLLVRRREVWFPTLLGATVLLAVCVTPALFWLAEGERILSANRGTIHEILVVDGWIQEEPMQAASVEFARGGYRYVVAAGGYTGAQWSNQRWSYAEIARKYLVHCGVPPARIISAQAPGSDVNRTYLTAVAVKVALDARELTPRAVTVYTRGAHAFRSRLVYQKVFGKEVEVGVISWKPPKSRTEPWWRDSERSVEFMKESFGSLWEWAFDSGRGR